MITKDTRNYGLFGRAIAGSALPGNFEKPKSQAEFIELIEKGEREREKFYESLLTNPQNKLEEKK